MWRSLLFVPILSERLVQSAPLRGADVIVLDLEAAVPQEKKDQARAQLSPLIPTLKSQSATVAVRVNPLDQWGDKDIKAASDAGADLLVLPKATPETTAGAAALVDAHAHHNLPLIPLIEDPRGVIKALAIAEAAPSVVALGFGVEDYAAAMGTAATSVLLQPAGFQVIQAAKAANLEALVIVDSIAEYKDLTRFSDAAKTSYAFGSTGGFAIHPAQVDILNDVFTPGEAEVVQAKRILEAAKNARQKGLAIASLDGQMIDEPVETRAKTLLARVRKSN